MSHRGPVARAESLVNIKDKSVRTPDSWARNSGSLHSGRYAQVIHEASLKLLIYFVAIN